MDSSKADVLACTRMCIKRSESVNLPKLPSTNPSKFELNTASERLKNVEKIDIHIYNVTNEIFWQTNI